MTDLFNLSPAKIPKTLVIHGLNNKPEAWDFFIKELQERGHEVAFITLPAHGENRSCLDFQKAMSEFEQNMRRHTEAPYNVVAFSLGALYFENWRRQNLQHAPKSLVLLAPAFFLKNEWQIKFLVNILPKCTKIKSLSPPQIRRYPSLEIWDYQLLIEGLSHLRNKEVDLPPTLTLIDPQDELVDARKLKAKYEVQMWERRNLKGLGAHHILFHPDFFGTEEWSHFLNTICSFLTAPL